MRAATDFEDHHARSLAHDKASAVAIERPRCPRRSLVGVGDEAVGARKASDRERVDARLGTSSNHHVGVAGCDEARGVADGVSTGSAGG